MSAERVQDTYDGETATCDDCKERSADILCESVGKPLCGDCHIGRECGCYGMVLDSALAIVVAGDLIRHALEIDGEHHKQWDLEMIASTLGIRIDDLRFERGIPA